MFSLAKEEILSLKTLVVIPILLGIGFSFFNGDYISFEKLAEEEIKRMNFGAKSDSNVILSSISFSKSALMKKVFINESTLEELSAFTGIGTRTASLIIKERNLNPFSSWDDFEKRLKYFSIAKLEKLRSLGVRIDSE